MCIIKSIKKKKDFVDIVKIQEYKLYKYIGLPAMWTTILSGSGLIYLNPSVLSGAWMHAKLALIVILTIYSLSLEAYRKQLENGECKKSGKFFRAYNEVPTILSILIVTFVILKDIPMIFSVGVTLFFVFIMYMIIKPSKTKNN